MSSRKPSEYLLAWLESQRETNHPDSTAIGRPPQAKENFLDISTRSPSAASPRNRTLNEQLEELTLEPGLSNSGDCAQSKDKMPSGQGDDALSQTSHPSDDDDPEDRMSEDESEDGDTMEYDVWIEVWDDASSQTSMSTSQHLANEAFILVVRMLLGD